MADQPKLPAMDPMTVEVTLGASYPPEFDAPCAARAKRRIGNALGLRNFEVNLVTLPPWVVSSQRHWHSHQDEFIHVIEGEVTLITDAGSRFSVPARSRASRPAGRTAITSSTVRMRTSSISRSATARRSTTSTTPT